MNLFDLHCDTVYECATKHKDLKENDLHLDLNRGIAATDKWVQTFAFWIADDLTEEEQYCSYQRQLSCFHTFPSSIQSLRPITEKQNIQNAVICCRLRAEAPSAEI